MQNAKTLLNNANIPFEEIKISAEDFDNFKQEHGVSTVPQLYFEDNLIGGYDAVKRLLLLIMTLINCIMLPR